MATTKQNFMRVVKVTIGDYTFDSENLHIEFESPFDDNYEPNVTTIKIWNLSKNTITNLKKGRICTLQAGYKGDYGVLTVGTVTSVSTKWSGVDKITTIKSTDGTDKSKEWVSAKNATKSTIKKNKDGSIKKNALAIKFKKGSKGLDMIKRLLSALDIKTASPIDLKRNKVYKKGFTVTKVIMNDLETIVNDCGSIIYWRRGKIVIRQLGKGHDEKFILKPETGLIGSPGTVDDDGVDAINVKCALQFRITTCSIITMESKHIKGKYRAYEGKHVCNGSDFYTEFKAV